MHYLLLTPSSRSVFRAGVSLNIRSFIHSFLLSACPVRMSRPFDVLRQMSLRTFSACARRRLNGPTVRMRQKRSCCGPRSPSCVVSVTRRSLTSPSCCRWRDWIQRCVISKHRWDNRPHFPGIPKFLFAIFYFYFFRDMVTVTLVVP